MVVQDDTKKDLDTLLYREKSLGETMKIKGVREGKKVDQRKGVSKRNRIGK